MKKFYLALLISCLSFAGYAQTAASYLFSRTTGTYTSIVGQSGTVATTAISNDDIGTSGIPIGFTFTYCGASTTTVAVCSNGWLSLTNNATVGTLSGSTGSITAGKIWPYWGDNWGTGATAYYQTTGTTGSRVFTFEWTNWNICCSGGWNQNYQVKLFEGTNIIQFRYGSFSSNTGGRTIGIGNSTTDYQTLPNETSTSTTTGFSTSCSLPANGTVLQWCPPAPPPIAGNTPVCVSDTRTLTNPSYGGTWTSGNTSVATIGASTGIVTGVSAGTATITYMPACGTTPATAVVTVNPAPSPSTGNAPINVCTTVTLSNSSGSGTWTSGNTSVATVNPSTGVVSGLTAGTAPITFTLTSSGCFTVSTVTVNALPAISGASSVCTGLTTTLSHTTSGGTWSSSGSAATVGASTGVVSGIAAGSVNITYTVPGGCTVVKAMTVNSNPPSISGAGAVCGGTVPTSTTFTNATSGGTWSSSNVALATVGSSTGVVTGVASGVPDITYTLSNGCYSTRAITVNAVAPITGVSGVCLGESSTLSNATFGGTWSSSNTSIATIGSTSGVVTSVAYGVATISYSVASTGCSAIVPFSVTSTPTVYAVTGGGSYCAGGAGVHIGVNNTNAGVNYVLYNGATAVASMIGTGAAIDFGFLTTAGTYTVVANPGSACATTMSGSATVSINPLPTAFTVGGGGNYCSGGTGVNITLSSSTIGVNYQLMLGATPIGSLVAGTSGSLSFGPVTTAGSYTVIATNGTTGCISGMSGSATVGINSLPTSFSVTGGGNFCLGGSGVSIGLSGSSVGTTYQLLLSGAPVGAPLTGTGSALSFGLINTGGLYSVLATTTATGCVATMSGTATVTVDPLPTVYTVTGGGAYCVGGTGVTVGLNGSAVGINYQLFNGSATVGSPVAGTGAAISFGLQTATGSYTVVATNATTGCVSNMFGSVSVSTNPLPIVFSVTGGGGYCAGGTGVVVGLSGSTVGTTYQLYNGLTLVGAAGGTGTAITFGLQTGPGSYNVVATTTLTGCVGSMSGSVTVTVNPLPTVYTVTGGGNYCAGGTGIAIELNGSTSGVDYQLYNGSTAVGSPVPGTGSVISFGLQTAAGSYTVVAVNATTGCTRNMSGSAVIIVNPLPTLYAVTGGGGYCTGGTGVHIGLANSNPGISYQLMNTGGPVGTAIAGTGSPLDFGLITTTGTYTVLATNPATACQSSMSGSAVVSINALPTAYTVVGGGNYCSGGAGVPVGLFSSTAGVNYQLYRGATAVGAAIAGTGGVISFGAQTAVGAYTVVATNATTGCSNNMLGTVMVAIDPLPGLFVVTGGGNYCSGGTGVHVGLGGSAVGINYQLMNGLATVGATVPGTGAALDFGLQTGIGNYTVVASNPSTGCTTTMTGSVNINTYPLPALFTINGGGNYCAGGTGVAIGLGGSATGFSYQLYQGTTAMGAPAAGTGAPLSFGLQTVAGTYTVVATNTSTGCSRTMIGTTTIGIHSLPAIHTITGGGNYCLGSTGTSIGLSGSNTGISYQLYNGTVAAGAAVPGSTGSPINFGLHTAMGLYKVVATNTTTGCVANMTGSVTVGVYPLPTVFVVTGGGNYCSGGAGVQVGLSGSASGETYQLMNGGSFVGSPVSGTGVAIDFGFQTTAGTYTVVATNTTTGCSNTMSGAVTVAILPLPALYTVTGGGNYCAGGAGVTVGLSGSATGTTYQLRNGLASVGTPLTGTGGPLSFGLQTTPGIYTVVATNITTTCTNIMTGSVTIATDPLPAVYSVIGGGNYCSGGTGVGIGLANSDIGFTYQLMNGTVATGSPIAGTGLPIDFGFQTVAGNYTVVATNTATGCTNVMGGGATVVVDPLPASFSVGGGGNYCAGGLGLNITLSGSVTGMSYQLKNGGVDVGLPLAGTGLPLDFGLQTAAGSYTVEATNNTTGCTNIMAGSVSIVINPLPSLFTIGSASSTYCAGGSGVNISLTGSELGVNYQLYHSGTPTGSALPGTGAAIDFGFVLPAGNYTAVGVNSTTGCTRTMTSSVSVIVNPLPSVYTVTGGGSYCFGGSGVIIGLSGSNPGISYQLMLGSAPSGSAVTGTGGPITFGSRTVAGVYTVVATNIATTCTSNMTGTASVAVNAVPAIHTVSGGGNYCIGSAGVHVTLSGSTLGVNYQLRRGITPVNMPVAGTGTALDFGAQTIAGSYTVVATDALSGCTSSMTGSASVGINPLPAIYTVIGGGSYCPGGSGVHVGISGSSISATYQLMLGGVATGSPVPGTGSAISFGLQTAAGSYTVVASDIVTGCTSVMSGSASVAVAVPPVAFNVIGGGNYCAGGAGVHVGLSSSSVGVNYNLFRGFTSVVTLPGTGGPLDFGIIATAGTYTVIGTNLISTCQTNMIGSVTITINPVVTPGVTINTSAGDTSCSGSLVTFTANPINGGSAPAYQWRINGVNTATGANYSFVPVNGDVIEVTLTSSAACALPAVVSNTKVMTVQPNLAPAVAVSANPGNVICQGTSVTFTATPTNGGASPTYTWVKNGLNSAISPSFTYTPADGDVVYCVMTSDYRCRTTNTAASSHVNMIVDMPVQPVVTITADPGLNIAAGQSVSFNATVVNGGTSPSYQWLVNGAVVPGAVTPAFTTSSLSDNDTVACIVLKSGGCPGLSGVGSVRVHIYGVGVPQVATFASDIKLIPNPNKGTFTVKGTVGSADEVVSLEVTNMLGQVIHRSSAQTHNGELNERIELQGTIANGMYILNLRSGSAQQVFHLVIEQ